MKNKTLAMAVRKSLSFPPYPLSRPFYDDFSYFTYEMEWNDHSHPGIPLGWTVNNGELQSV
jgi:hypothetical protein